MEASKPKAVMTASCGIEGSKGPLAYKVFAPTSASSYNTSSDRTKC
jgi:propionyl-CoA synthetase